MAVIAYGAVLAASVPGGTARHYRVQVYRGQQWQLHASFACREQADECCRQLLQSAEASPTRIVCFQICPAAA